MAAPPAGRVVLIRFPFSDLSRSKFRPALVLAIASPDDVVLCQITSNPYSDPRAVAVEMEDFETGSLQRTSYARPGKLFTASLSLLDREAGTLRRDAFLRVSEAVIRLLRDAHTIAPE